MQSLNSILWNDETINHPNNYSDSSSNESNQNTAALTMCCGHGGCKTSIPSTLPCFSGSLGCK